MGNGKMLGVVHYALREKAIEVRECPMPQIKPDEVLLQVEAVSVCGSEVHHYFNTLSWPVNVPVILGHEFCGVVAEKGSDVRGFAEGDRVVSETAARICGACTYCLTGEYNLCRKRLGFGYGVDGGMAQYVAVPARCLHRLPDRLSFEEAAMTEPTSVAYNAVAVKSQIRPGESVAVMGPGPIGLLCLQMARVCGASPLLMLGVAADRPRLNLARELGADITVDVETENAVEKVNEIGDGLGLHVVIDATGHSAALKQALELVRPGGRITKVGWGPTPLNFSLDPLVQKAVTLQGSFSHNYPMWEQSIKLLAEGKIRTQPLAEKIAPLADWESCVVGMAQREIVKAVLKPQES
ncbi:MAG: zinc-binding dehydrogenase [Acidobacteria bacterium]|nr:zinc-binding dehydrogenase [Acidobacteriota bacterium]